MFNVMHSYRTWWNKKIKRMVTPVLSSSQQYTLPTSVWALLLYIYILWFFFLKIARCIAAKIRFLINLLIIINNLVLEYLLSLQKNSLQSIWCMFFVWDFYWGKLLRESFNLVVFYKSRKYAMVLHTKDLQYYFYILKCAFLLNKTIIKNVHKSQSRRRRRHRYWK